MTAAGRSGAWIDEIMTVTRFSPRRKVTRDNAGGESMRIAPSPSPAISTLSPRSRSLLKALRRSFPGVSLTCSVTALAGLWEAVNTHVVASVRFPSRAGSPSARAASSTVIKEQGSVSEAKGEPPLPHATNVRPVRLRLHREKSRDMKAIVQTLRTLRYPLHGGERVRTSEGGADRTVLNY